MRRRRILLQLFADGQPEGGQPSGGSSSQPAGDSPAPAVPNSRPQDGPQDSPQGGRVYSEDYVRALRGEAADYRRQLSDLRGALREVLGLQPDAPLPQDLKAAFAGLREAAQKEAAQMIERAKSALVKAAFKEAAAGKVADAEDAFALAAQELADAVEVDLETATVKVKPGADGKERTMSDIVDALLERKPYLRVQAGPAGVGGTAPAGGVSGKESPQEVARRIAEQRKAARGGEGRSFWDRYRKGV